MQKKHVFQENNQASNTTLFQKSISGRTYTVKNIISRRVTQWLIKKIIHKKKLFPRNQKHVLSQE